jgi:hypothetical protein
MASVSYITLIKLIEIQAHHLELSIVWRRLALFGIVWPAHTKNRD